MAVCKKCRHPSACGMLRPAKHVSKTTLQRATTRTSQHFALRGPPSVSAALCSAPLVLSAGFDRQRFLERAHARFEFGVHLHCFGAQWNSRVDARYFRRSTSVQSGTTMACLWESIRATASRHQKMMVGVGVAPRDFIAGLLASYVRVIAYAMSALPRQCSP